MRQQTMRRHNLALVLNCVLSSTVSRSDIAARTGLTRATVSALVDVLIEAGMVAELAPVPSPGAGRPAVPLVPARGTLAAVGVEVNVDYLGVRALDLSRDVLVETVETGDFRGSDPTVVLAQVADATSRVVDQLTDAGTRTVGVGLALPGLLDQDRGIVHVAPNLGWRDFHVAEALASPPFDRCTVRLGNEADLAARAEIQTREEPSPSFLYVNGEVGVGGALVHEGRVFSGPRGGAGEIGHTTIEPDGPDCPCGSRGCLERYAGKDALMRAAGLPPDAPIHDLAARVVAGDVQATDSVSRAGWALGVAVANMINLVAIDEIVLAGTFTPLHGLLRPGMAAELERRVLLSPWSRFRIEMARGPGHAAMTGAALAVLQEVVADPAAWATA